MTDDWENDSAINSAECYKLAIDQLRVNHLMRAHGDQGHASLDGRPILHADGRPVRPGDLEEGKTYDIVPFEGGWRFVPREGDA